MTTASLQHGPYPTPLVVKGTRLVCGVRGVVRIVGLSNAAIPWPIGEQDGQQELVVYRGLARAIRSESADAIAVSWGVTVATVAQWQAAIEKPGNPSLRSEGLRKPWTQEADAVVLRTPDNAKVAALLGRTYAAVKFRRYYLNRSQPKASVKMRDRPRQRGIG